MENGDDQVSGFANCIDRGGMHLLGRGGSSAGLSWCPSFSWVRLHVGDGRQGPGVCLRPAIKVERDGWGVAGEMQEQRPPRCISWVVLEKSCAAMAAMDGLLQGLFVPTNYERVWGELHTVGIILWLVGVHSIYRLGREAIGCRELPVTSTGQRREEVLAGCAGMETDRMKRERWSQLFF